MNIDTIHVYISLSSYKKHHLPVLKNTALQFLCQFLLLNPLYCGLRNLYSKNVNAETKETKAPFVESILRY